MAIRYGARSDEQVQARRERAAQADIWSTLLTAVYETDPEVVAAVLPPPLVPADEPLVRVTMATVDLGPGVPTFGAGTFAVLARHGATVGSYPLVMPMTSEQAVIGGREIYGEPKKLADVGLERRGDRVRGWFTRMGTTFVTVEGTVTGEVALVDPPRREPERVDFYFKFLPAPDGKGFDDEPALVHCTRHEATRALHTVDGTVTLAESRFDPVADLPVRRVRSIELAERSSTQRGEIVERVPGEWLAHFAHQRYDDLAPPVDG
jgi:acetoacetate decarboxylase